MPIEIEENDYTCGNCKYCGLCDTDEICGDWEEDKDELTDDEKREIVGDRKAHEIMETEGHIE